MEGAGATTSNLPSLEGWAGPQVSGEDSPVPAALLCALPHACSLPMASPRHTESKVQLPPSAWRQPTLPGTWHQSFQMHPLSSSASPYFFMWRVL